MASENAKSSRAQEPKPASENKTRVSPGRRGRPPRALPTRYATILQRYTEALASAPLSAQTRRTYESKVRQYLAWLATAELDGDPLKDKRGRDWAVRDYRTHLQTVLKRKPASGVSI
jgi:integrase/recombinase XerD